MLKTALARVMLVAALVLCGSALAEEAAAPQGPPPAAVSVMTVAPGDAGVSYEYVGQVAGSREVEVRARVTGIVEARLYEEGARVEKDAVLFRIDPAPYKAALAVAEAHVAQAEAQSRQASRDYERIKPLAKAEAASRKELDDAESGFALAKAAVQAAKAERDVAQINFDYTDVKAPIAGITGRALKVEGSLANAQGDSLLTTMAQTDPVYVDFSISAEDERKLREDLAAGRVVLPTDGFTVHLKSSDGQELPQQGKMDFRDYKTDAKTGSFAARATIPNEAGTLAPGQFVRVILAGAKRANVVTVPQQAVLDGATGKYVYVAVKGEHGLAAMPHPVVTGPWVDGNGWIIEQGLAPGDQVIVDGMARIYFPGAPVMIAPEAPAAPEAAKP